MTYNVFGGTLNLVQSMNQHGLIKLNSILHSGSSSYHWFRQLVYC